MMRRHTCLRPRIARCLAPALLAAVCVAPAVCAFAAAPPLERPTAGLSVRAALRRSIDTRLIDGADQLINDSIARGDIPGAVLLVGRGDRVVYRKAYGNRSIEPQKTPMTVDTIFDLASLSKPVGCAASIMILADRGKIDLHERVAKYLPGFAQNAKEEITVEQLLLHWGGLVPD